LLRAPASSGSAASARRNNPGLLLMQRGRWQEARAEFERAIKLAPASAEARVNLGALLIVQGQRREAVQHLRQGLAAEPWRTEIRMNLAWIFATSPDDQLRNGREAVKLAEEAIALSGRRDAAAADVLAAAHAGAGRFDAAVRIAEEALRLAGPDTAQAAEMAARLDGYRRRRPWREPR
jgi:Flp pilus assembly protein TadD